jgi:tRNA C32,U32 (ribose-2'-O)-methylase TrmJ
MRLWRRVLGRAHPTGREASTMRGLFRRASGLLEHPERLQNEE